LNRRDLVKHLAILAVPSVSNPAPRPPFVEVIASTLQEARIAHAAGASRIELAIHLESGGLTPPIDLVRGIARSVPIPMRVMLRGNSGFEIASPTEHATLLANARALAQLPIEGLVLGFLIDSRIDLTVLEELAHASRLPITFHNALERTADPIVSMQSLLPIRQVDTLLVHGSGPTPLDSLRSLAPLAAAWQRGSRRLLVNGYSVSDIHRLRPLVPFAASFHFGSQVRTPELPYPHGALDEEKLRSAIRLLAEN
jgi:copper homeostasis protein